MCLYQAAYAMHPGLSKRLVNNDVVGGDSVVVSRLYTDIFHNIFILKDDER